MIGRASFCFLVCACALTSKSDSMTIRYFTPEKVAQEHRAAQDPPKTQGFELRIGKVSSSTHLKEKIAFRESEREIGFYDTLRWTEKPESYLRRATYRLFYETFAFKHVLSGSAPTLEIELTAFDEIRSPSHVARINLTWTLRDDQTVFSQRMIAVEKAVQGTKADDSPSNFAASMSLALDEAVKTMADGVLAELSKAK